MKRTLTAQLLSLTGLVSLGAPTYAQVEPAAQPLKITAHMNEEEIDPSEVEDAQTSKKVVQLTIRDVFEDVRADSPFAPKQLNLRQRIEMLRHLATDDSVDGLRIEIKGSPDHARALDLLFELRAVKAAGKKIVCYAETLSQSALVFASLADHMAVPPSGMVTLEGLTLELMYMKDLLAKLDIEAHVLHIGDFKTAFENMSRETMSDEQRKTLENLLDEFYGQMVRVIAENRGMEQQEVLAQFDKVLLQPGDALAAGLIDAVAYQDEFDSECELLFGGNVVLDKEYGRGPSQDIEEMLDSPFAMFKVLPMILKPPTTKLPNEPRIAVVYATGPIGSGKSQRGWDGSVASMGSETIVEALETALEDDWVRAVVLRVNSPGGSALASDMIWHATQRVRAKKPIIASMGSVAASGGYWISMGCNEIMAQPSTITGSIGVVALLPDLSKTLKNKLGINVEVVGKGPHAQELAMLRSGPSPFLKNLVTTSMQDVYEEFLRKVAEGRRTTPQQIGLVAKGRVWTGREAVDINLVDRLGGLDDAINRACELAGIDPATTHIAEYPKPMNFFEQLEESFEDMATVGAPSHGIHSVLEQLGYSDAVQVVEMLTADAAPLSADRIQALLPWILTVR